MGESTPLGGLTVALVGPGRVGTSLARWLAAAGAVVIGVAGRSESDRASELAAELGAPTISLARAASERADLLLVAVPDGALGAVVEALAPELGSRSDRPRAALHTSGRRGAEVLEPLRERGVAVGTLHPLLSFPRPLPRAAAAGAVFALHGDPEAVALGRDLAAACGATPVVVGSEERSLYHLAASVAAGGVSTLVLAAGEIAGRTGLDPAIAEGYRRLAASAVEAISGETGAVITGPVVRGEWTFLEQLAELERTAPDLVSPIASLGLLTLRLVARSEGDLDPGQRQLRDALRELLARPSPS